MLQLPTPILGQITAFTITTPDLDQSLAFYLKLGFIELYRADWPFPWIQITDGAILIMLRQDKQLYIALTYYVNNIEEVAAGLLEKGIKFTFSPSPNDAVQRYVMQSPDGAFVSLVSLIEGFSQPPGPVMLKMNPAHYGQPEQYVNKVCGMFGEFAQPVSNLDEAAEWYARLGFRQLSRYNKPYPWGIYSDGLAVVGLHQTTHFTLPAITFFAADMHVKIAYLKQIGLPVTNDRNDTLQTPEGQKINLFTLGG